MLKIVRRRKSPPPAMPPIAAGGRPLDLAGGSDWVGSRVGVSEVVVEVDVLLLKVVGGGCGGGVVSPTVGGGVLLSKTISELEGSAPLSVGRIMLGPSAVI